MTLAIDVHDLVKRYGTRTVVDRVNLGIEQGRICGFLGPNGSGKTTILRMICGLLTPDGGGGTCLGHDLVRERDAIKHQTGYMTQRFGLYEDLTIRENLDFVSRVYGLDRTKERVDQSLGELSGYGMVGVVVAVHQFDQFRVGEAFGDRLRRPPVMRPGVIADPDDDGAADLRGEPWFVDEVA